VVLSCLGGAAVAPRTSNSEALGSILHLGRIKFFLTILNTIFLPDTILFSLNLMTEIPYAHFFHTKSFRVYIPAAIRRPQVSQIVA
jgi:hypothetical protein